MTPRMAPSRETSTQLRIVLTLNCRSVTRTSWLAAACPSAVPAAVLPWVTCGTLNVMPVGGNGRVPSASTVGRIDRTVALASAIRY